MSRDKSNLADADVPLGSTDILSVIFVFEFCCCSLPLYIFRPLLTPVWISHCVHDSTFQSSLSHPLCQAVLLVLSLAVSLSGQGVGTGDSVLWNLSWLRPKLSGPYGAAAPLGSLLTHLFLSFLLSLALVPLPIFPPSDLFSSVCPFFSLHMWHTVERKLPMIHHPHCLMDSHVCCQASGVKNGLFGDGVCSAGNNSLARVGQPLPLLPGQSALAMHSKQDCGRQETVPWASVK